MTSRTLSGRSGPALVCLNGNDAKDEAQAVVVERFEDLWWVEIFGVLRLRRAKAHVSAQDAALGWEGQKRVSSLRLTLWGEEMRACLVASWRGAARVRCGCPRGR